MAGLPPDTATPGRAFTLEPYSYAEARSLIEELDLPEPVAVTLVRRGYRTVAEARAFLDADEEHDPFAFDRMGEVVERIRDAIAAGCTITVHGDYDCDGVCSTAILVRTLRELGANCDWYIPDRLQDGYGLSAEGVKRLAARGTGLLLTTDCGIGCAEEVAAAQEVGIDVIVTDHHEPGERLPDCPVLHPRLSGYPCDELCATGVAYKLGAALLGADMVERELDLVALATVADLVPLRGENRALVRGGLAVARRAGRPGLRALCRAAGVEPVRLDEGDIAFRLAPRVNAAGRLYRADAGVELMLTEDRERAEAIAAELDDANSERRDAERFVVDAAERARSELTEDLASAPALVLAGEGWHAGVVGIAASRLVERHWVPVVLIGVDDEGRGRGSGRAIPGFDLLGALDACGEHLTRYGGHRAAAGLEIEADRIEPFREAFAAHATKLLGERELVRTEGIDAVVGGESLGHEVAEQLGRLAPFGMGNPGVRLLVPSARLCDVRPMGEAERHARFRLESGSRSALGVAFGVNGDLAPDTVAEPLDVSLKLELNEWQGAVSPRVVLGELYPGRPNRAPTETPQPDEREWMARLDAERDAPLGAWPPSERGEPGPPPRRETIDRRGSSGVATVAAVASSGGTVLVLCADALRRRALVESAATPARFGGGTVAIASGRLADGATRAALAAVVEAGTGVALADWAALERGAGMASAFDHVVIVDPPPFRHLERAASCGQGFVHLAWSEAEVELALRVHAEDWPDRRAVEALYRSLRSAAEDRSRHADGLRVGQVRDRLHGPGRYPRSPEVAARRLRLLEELGAVSWDYSATARSLLVVSSKGNLEELETFVAYRVRYEEGRQFLSGSRQPS
ncbi:MAG TPA: single-stranded-DNA-specific exonuclease RecJ [Solirubrobacterales bacterium]